MSITLFYIVRISMAVGNWFTGGGGGGVCVRVCVLGRKVFFIV